MTNSNRQFMYYKVAEKEFWMLWQMDNVIAGIRVPGGGLTSKVFKLAKKYDGQVMKTQDRPGFVNFVHGIWSSIRSGKSDWEVLIQDRNRFAVRSKPLGE